MELSQQFHDRDLVSVKAYIFLTSHFFWHFSFGKNLIFHYGRICNQSPNVYFVSFKSFLANFLEGNLQQQQGQFFQHLKAETLF